jgi:hypothetical protein
MISSYRLGDLVLHGLNENDKNKLMNDYPNSIGFEYAIDNYIVNDINKITNIVLNYINKYSNLLPEDIEESTVIHLRLGDVICGNEWHEKAKRPLSLDYLKKHLPNNTKTYIIGKCFFASDSSTNYDECTQMSNKYLKDVIDYFQAEHFDGGTADIDLCCAVKCKYFIQGMGWFSELISKIRNNLKLITLKTIPEKKYLFPPSEYSIKNDKNTVLFIEPRKIDHCSNVLYNTYKYLKDDWNYVFYCGKNSSSYWKSKLPDFIELRELEYENLNQMEYSNLLKKKELWNSLYGDFVLTVQLDTWIFNIEPYTIDYYLNLNKSYIGGNMSYNWNQLLYYGINPQIRNFNGGLSLRKKKDMIKIIENYPPMKTLEYNHKIIGEQHFESYHEDIYFTIGCYKLILNIGDDIESSKFSLHTIYHEKFFGIHNAHDELRYILNAKYPYLVEKNPYIYFDKNAYKRKNNKNDSNKISNMFLSKNNNKRSKIMNMKFHYYS